MTLAASDAAAAERDLLYRRLRALENRLQVEGRTREVSRSIHACRLAIAWSETRQHGRDAALWGPGGMSRRFAAVMSIGALVMPFFQGHPLVAWRVAAAIVFGVGCAVGGAALLGRMYWQRGEADYHRELVLATGPGRTNES